METQTGGCLYERLVPVKTAEQIMEIFSDYDALREVYYGGKGYAEAEEFSRVGEYIAVLRRWRHMYVRLEHRCRIFYN